MNSLSDSQMLQAKLIGFTHEKSGAELVWIKNSDPELAFSIGYHTPYIDETDTNHIFEHAILASSEKYPSKNFFLIWQEKAIILLSMHLLTTHLLFIP